MSFSVDKCHTICFFTKKSNLDTTYVLNNHVLTKVHHYCYLGVILSEDLKWSEYILHNYNIKCQTNCWYYQEELQKCLCRLQLSQLYNSLVRPKIEYANSAWYPYLKKDMHHLGMIQQLICSINWSGHLSKEDEFSLNYQCFIRLFIKLLILTKIHILLLYLILQGVVTSKPS